MEKLDIVINHATLREQWALPAFLAGCARRGLRSVSLWGEEIDKVGLDAARGMLSDSGLRTFGYNRAGPLLAETGTGRRALLDAARREIDQAAAVGADHILTFTGGFPSGGRDLAAERTQAEEAIAALQEHACGCGIRLALEPLHPMLVGDRTVIASLTHANDLCDRLGGSVGVAVDVYHVWWDERLEGELARAGAAGRILGFHVNDWLVPTKHMLRDRGMMGDGVIDLARLWRLVRKAGYAGPVEVEIFSEHWWKQDPDHLLDTAIARCEEIFRLVEVEG